ncbi:MAG: threonine/serine dehydratase [Gemmatimonadaceae bacterium]
MTDAAELVSLDDIREARERVMPRLHRTPLATSRTLGTRTKTKAWLKLELFQKTGSFKPRGVLNTLSQLSPHERQRGVISISAGNHAQALAWGASSMGVQCTMVMPATAVRTKIEATREYGAEVILTTEDLLATCLQVQRERSLTLVHPFDDLRVIAGAGTVGLEVMEDLSEVDAVIVGCGGGGLLAGVAAAVKQRNPLTKVIGVEPRGANGMIQSLAKGEAVRLTTLSTIADGLAAPFAGVRNLAHVQAFVDEMVEVEDDEIVDAMRFLMQRAKVVAEPAGAAATAALLSGKVTLRPDSVVAVIVSGGNVDLDRLRSLLAPSA